MPELPEVETTRRGIAPYLEGRRIRDAIVRDARLRWPVAPDLPRRLRDAEVAAVERRAKYLLLRLAESPKPGTVILHLGMSGSLRIVPQSLAPATHDHVDLLLDSGLALRLRDPRRFGSLHWHAGPIERHPLLARLGPEPLSAQFDGEWLYAAARGRRVAIKAFIMNSQVVVGVGNIYACEALFRAGIHPRLPAGRIGRARMQALAMRIREVLGEAIAAGGTTLRDFASSDGSPGYFSVQLRVYGRAGEACPTCGTALRLEVIGQRSTVFCPRCQR